MTTPCQIESFKKAKPRFRADHARILDLLKSSRRGLTYKEVAGLLKLPVTTAVGRLSEMDDLGAVIRVGRLGRCTLYAASSGFDLFSHLRRVRNADRLAKIHAIAEDAQNYLHVAPLHRAIDEILKISSPKGYFVPAGEK